MSVALRILAVLSVLATLLIGTGSAADATPTPDPTPSGGIATPRATPSGAASGRPPTPSATPSVSPSKSPTPATVRPSPAPSAGTSPRASATPTPTATPIPTTPVAEQRAASPRATVGGDIGIKWNALGGTQSFLGDPQSNEICGLRQGGCFQIFKGGSIYWTPTTGAHFIRGSIAERWAGLGWETGALGYPTSDEICGLTRGGCVQRFSGGNIYSSSAGTFAIWGQIMNRYSTLDWERGRLGYPIGVEQCGLRDGGCVQRFEGGNVYFSGAGTFAVWGEILKQYSNQDWERGRLGLPKGAENCVLRDGGCVQDFTGGNIYFTSSTGAVPIWGGMLDRFGKLGWEGGRLGYPKAAEKCGLRDGGCVQDFTGGNLYHTQATGAVPVWGAMLDRYAKLGWEFGSLGYPRAAEKCGLRDGGCVQDFTGGNLYHTQATGAVPVWGAMLDRYAKLGWEFGSLGYPKEPEKCGLRDGGCVQDFTGGNIYYSPGTGAVPTWGAILGRYAAAGWEYSRLGYPLDSEDCTLRDGGCVQRYQGGLIYFTGATGARAVFGAIVGSYAGQNWEKGKLGYPIGDEYCGLAGQGCAQNFEGGLIQFSPATGAHPIWGAVMVAYGAQGWERGPLGYPTESEFCQLRDGGCAQRFQQGLIYWSGASGAHPVRGAILKRYAELGWETGTLGYPKGAEGAPSGGRIRQDFQGGALVFDQATGRVSGPDGGGGGGLPLIPGNYPDADAAPCGYLFCKNGSVYSARGFAYRNCTDFAAYRRGMVWSQINGSGDGNARGWRNGWIQRGRTVSNVPKVGAIAWWSASATSSGYGHVAIVIGVNADGSAKVEEYNYATPGGYGIRNSVRAEAYLY